MRAIENQILKIIKTNHYVTAKDIADKTTMSLKQASDKLRFYAEQNKIVKLRRGYYAITFDAAEYLDANVPKSQPRIKQKDRYDLSTALNHINQMVRKSVKTNKELS